MNMSNLTNELVEALGNSSRIDKVEKNVHFLEEETRSKTKYPKMAVIPTPSELTIMSCPPSPKPRSRMKEMPTLFCFDNLHFDETPKCSKNDQEQGQQMSRRPRARYTTTLTCNQNKSKARASPVKQKQEKIVCNIKEESTQSQIDPDLTQTQSGRFGLGGRRKTWNCGFESRKDDSMTDFLRMERLAEKLTKDFEKNTGQKHDTKMEDENTESKEENTCDNNYCKQCTLYKENLKRMENRVKKLEKVKSFCQKEIKALRDDLSRAKNLIAQQSTKLQQLPWVVPSNESAVIKPKVDYFSCRTFDKDSPLDTLPGLHIDKLNNNKVSPGTTKTVKLSKERNKVGFVVPPPTLNKVEPKSVKTYSSQRSTSAPTTKPLYTDMKKTYANIHRLKKLRNEKTNFQPVTGTRNPTLQKVQNLTIDTTTRSKSLPRNSKINIVVKDKIQKVTDKSTEILAIAVASREGLIREIAHSIRKAKRILHFRFDMLIASDFDIEDFHFLLTSHRRFIRWLHNYINYSRALMRRFDEEHLNSSNSKFFVPAIIRINENDYKKGIFIPLPNSKGDNSDNTKLITANFLNPQSIRLTKTPTTITKVSQDLRLACTQTIDTRLNPCVSLAIQSSPQMQDFNQNFNGNEIQSQFDTKNNQEFSFTSKRNVPKPTQQDKGTCTEFESISSSTLIDDCGQRSSEVFSNKRNVALQYIESRVDIQVEKIEAEIISPLQHWSGHPQINDKNETEQQKITNCAANFQTTQTMTNDSSNGVEENCPEYSPVKVVSDSVQMEELWFEHRTPKINSSLLSQNLNVYKPYQDDCQSDIKITQPKSVETSFKNVEQTDENNNSVTNKLNQHLSDKNFPHCYQPQLDSKIIENKKIIDKYQERSPLMDSQKREILSHDNLTIKRNSTGPFSPMNLIEDYHIKKEAEKFYSHKGNSQMMSLEPEVFLSYDTTTNDPQKTKTSRKRLSTVTRSKSSHRLGTQKDLSHMEKYFQEVKKYKEYLANPIKSKLPNFPSAAQMVLGILNETCKEQGNFCNFNQQMTHEENNGDGEYFEQKRTKNKTNQESQSTDTDIPLNDDLDNFIHSTKNLLKEQISEILQSQNMSQGFVYKPVIETREKEANFNMPTFSLKQFLDFKALHCPDLSDESSLSMEQLKNKKSRPQFIFQDFNKNHPSSSSRQEVPSRLPVPISTEYSPVKIDPEISPFATPGISEVQIPSALQSTSKISISSDSNKIKVKHRSFIPIATKIKTKQELGRTSKILHQIPVKRLDKTLNKDNRAASFSGTKSSSRPMTESSSRPRRGDQSFSYRK